MAVLLMTENA